MSNEALESGLRKLFAYAHGYYRADYIHLTQTEAKALYDGLTKLAGAADQK